MSRQSRLEQTFTSHLMPTLLKIHDETHQHSVPLDSESHFKVVLVSTCFEQQSRVARHRLVQQLVAHEFITGLHALSLHLYTPEEWGKKNSTVPASPACEGKNRHVPNTDKA